MASGVSSYFDLAGSKGITLRIYYQETYDITTNASTLAITDVQIYSATYKGIVYYPNGTIKIGGTTVVTMDSYSGTHSIYVGAVNTWYSISGSWGSLSGIAHSSDGSGSATIAVDVTGVYTGGGYPNGWVVSGSKTVTLTTIPRKSSLTVPSSGTLGTAMTITADRKADSFTHTLTYSCGNYSGTIASQSGATSWSFTPPLDFAYNNPSGTSVSCAFTLYTYSGATHIGTDTQYVTLTIPESLVPSCSLSLSDPTGYLSTFGGYVKMQSKLTFSVGFAGSYGSTLVSCTVSANGVQYSAANGTTDVLTTAGTNTVTVTVTDSRGRSATDSETITVLDYSPPAITKLSVIRCNEDGTENINGSYIKATYSYRITSLSNKNTKVCRVDYKKISDGSYTQVSRTAGYSVTNETYIFAADDGSSFDVRLYVADYFSSITKNTTASTAAAIMHFKANGKGMGIGKIAEGDGLEIGWDTTLYGVTKAKNAHNANFGDMCIYRGAADLSEPGWYKILTSGNGANFFGISGLLFLSRTYNNHNNEAYTVSINAAYSGGSVAVLNKFVGGTGISKVALYKATSTAPVTIYVYYNLNVRNSCYFTYLAEYGQTAFDFVAETPSGTEICTVDL